MATLIDGKAIAAALRQEIAGKTEILKNAHGITPGLAVVQVGNDAASEVYVRNKVKLAGEAGFHSVKKHLPEETTLEELLAVVNDLNEDDKIHGILVQLPLPKHIPEEPIIEAISPKKDVDGFHPINSGKLWNGEEDGFVPCTPLGCSLMLKAVAEPLSGKHAVVIGRSNIVGKPMAALLLRESCTVTVTHSRTKDLPEMVRQADIVVAAVGRPEMVKGEWIKEGAVVIDVGINRVETAGGQSRLVGDVDFAECEKKASAITPVPGGVGPMTIACLLKNTLTSAERSIEKK